MTSSFRLLRPFGSKGRGIAASGIALASVSAVMTHLALAVPPPARETKIEEPGRSIAGNDQSSAIATNPANVAFLPGTEARWTWVRTGQDAPEPSRGHAFDLAFALPFHLGTGLRLDLVRPSIFGAAPFNVPYSWL